MVCLPSPRASLHTWIQRRGYVKAGGVPYPATALGHEITLPEEEDIQLIMYVKALEAEDGAAVSSDTKDKPAVLGLAGPAPSFESQGKSRMHLPPFWRQTPPAPPSDDDDDDGETEEAFMSSADGKDCLIPMVD